VTNSAYINRRITREFKKYPQATFKFHSSIQFVHFLVAFVVRQYEEDKGKRNKGKQRTPMSAAGELATLSVGDRPAGNTTPYV
jgi:hypothetical protein